jgi:hypothetical protein
MVISLNETLHGCAKAPMSKVYAKVVFCKMDKYGAIAYIGNKTPFQHDVFSCLDYYHFKKQRISDYIRVTVGSASEMQAFITAVKEILGE